MHNGEASQAAVEATYRVRGNTRKAERIARAIAFEQTVELPPGQVTDAAILDDVVGHVEAVEPDPVRKDACRVRIHYNNHLSSGGLGQLFNLLYGNVSMYDAVRLIDIELPDQVLADYPGPRYGVAGLRKLSGVHGRPLLATALKPRGSSPEKLAAMAETFALVGGDIVKDDQNLVDGDFDAFRRRVDKCAAAVERANAANGRRCLYLPHLAGPDENLERAAEFVHARGLVGALVCPMVVGLDRARALCEQYDLVFMAHPALSGAYTQSACHGIDHDILLGTLFRLAGADISVFGAHGGRFDIETTPCLAIAQALRRPMGELQPALPAPAGGMHLCNVPELARDYGEDAVWLVGGALHEHPEGIAGGTRAFMDALRANFNERLNSPADSFISACESPPVNTQHLRTLISVLNDFHWEDREEIGRAHV